MPCGAQALRRLPMGYSEGMDDRDVARVLEFWFGELDELGRADEEHASRWYTKDPEFDARLRAAFEPLHAEVLRGERDAWLATPRSRLAYIVVLDQFSRNMYRESPRSFEGDEKALAACRSGIETGMDRPLAFDERWFFYMPLQHSEDPAVQDFSVETFRRLRDEAPPELRERAQVALDFAIRHRDIIVRFGRYPHRNAVLGRESTPEEIEFLKQPNSSF